jgi:hypothetical protein
MEKHIENISEIKDKFHKIEAIKKSIKGLKKELEDEYKSIDEKIHKGLIEFDWQPKYNEKVIHINTSSRDAWYLWYVESWGNNNRFREAPADFPKHSINNYYSQPMQPDAKNSTHSWIIPLTLFKEIEEVISFNIYPEKHQS